MILSKKIDMNVKEDNYRKRMYLGQDGNALVQLLVLNAVIFVVLKFVFIFFLLTNASNDSFLTHVYNWFVLSANPEKIAWRPWTVISFMFTDQQLFRFISNMFWLWSFGYILQDLTGNRKLIPVYLYGGIRRCHYLCNGPCSNPGSSVTDRQRLSFSRKLFHCGSSCCNNSDITGLPDFPYDQRRYSAMDPYLDFSFIEFFRSPKWRHRYLYGICRLPQVSDFYL